MKYLIIEKNRLTGAITAWSVKSAQELVSIVDKQATRYGHFIKPTAKAAIEYLKRDADVKVVTSSQEFKKIDRWHFLASEYAQITLAAYYVDFASKLDLEKADQAACFYTNC